ncbi:MAG: hypothetical protein J6W06_06630 [Bacteroidales bacterium]|nr:hypothetical protein [Bacteroidales bacterium]
MEARPNMIKRFNNPIFGLLIGIIVPIIAFLIYWIIEFFMYGFGLIEFINRLIEIKSILPPSLCVFANLIPYFIFKKIDYWYAVKGLVYSLVIYTLIFVVLTFIK